MNFIYRYITLLALLFAVGCVASEEVADTTAQGELSATVSLTRSSEDSSSDSSILDSGVLKIYNSTGGLVRYYTAVSSFTEYLAVGDYYATYRAGEEVDASFEGVLSYYGESGVVSVTSQQSSTFEIEATVQNTILAIEFDDETLGVHYNEYSVVAYVANSLEEVDEDTLTLTYESSKDGYFLIPEGVENMVWSFINDGDTIISGVVASVKRGYKYSVSFQYTDYLNVSGLSISFIDTEYKDDTFDFKVQPIVECLDFEDGAVIDYLEQQSFNLSVTSISPLSSINVTVGSDLYDVTFTDDASLSEESMVYDTTTNKLTLKEGFIESLDAGSYRDITIVATAANNATDQVTLQVGVSGFASHGDEDFWAATSRFTWYTSHTPESVQMRYRCKGDEAWIGTYEAASTGGHLWSATNTVEWSEPSLNEYNNVVYEYINGYQPSQEYEYQMIIDGEESDIISITSSDCSMDVTDGDFSDSSLSCYTTNNDYATFWASGNNSITSSLCTYDSTNGCAYMSTNSTGPAAGNLFTGTFSMSGFSGTASFGQKFSWTMRPKYLTLRYKVTVGSGDKGRIYAAIVSWSSRHGVTSSTSGDPSNTWDPVSDTSVTEGQIIGYGSIHFESSTSSFAELKLPIYYYDKEAIPTGTYQIVISCTSSYRGDYLEGSSDSKLWVDDFKFE